MPERTLVIVKPDAMAAGVAAAVLEGIERAGLTLRAARNVWMRGETAEAFYAEHLGKDFFPGLVEFMSSGPGIVAVFEGEEAVARARAAVGATDPAKATPETIRGRFGSELPRNAVHASDSPESARREIAFFFAEADLLGQ
jgi:nucleoside-diphosphate kinase